VSTLPDLRGKSVLDVAAWDGFFSFEAERLGAGRVVTLSLDMGIGHRGLHVLLAGV
jgi:predicted RNA methylase